LSQQRLEIRQGVFNYVPGFGNGRCLHASSGHGVLVFGVLLILALISAPVDGCEPPGAHLRTPRETLDEHLTRGEITREEYVDRRTALDFKTAII
jgi:hypothetical protein